MTMIRDHFIRTKSWLYQKNFFVLASLVLGGTIVFLSFLSLSEEAQRLADERNQLKIQVTALEGARDTLLARLEEEEGVKPPAAPEGPVADAKPVDATDTSKVVAYLDMFDKTGLEQARTYFLGIGEGKEADVHNWGIGNTQLYLGIINQLQNQTEPAIEKYNEALSKFTSEGYDLGRAVVYLNLAIIAEAEGDDSAANRYAAQADEALAP